MHWRRVQEVRMHRCIQSVYYIQMMTTQVFGVTSMRNDVDDFHDDDDCDSDFTMMTAITTTMTI